MSISHLNILLSELVFNVERHNVHLLTMMYISGIKLWNGLLYLVVVCRILVVDICMASTWWTTWNHCNRSQSTVQFQFTTDRQSVQPMQTPHPPTQTVCLTPSVCCHPSNSVILLPASVQTQTLQTSQRRRCRCSKKFRQRYLNNSNSTFRLQLLLLLPNPAPTPDPSEAAPIVQFQDSTQTP